MILLVITEFLINIIGNILAMVAFEHGVETDDEATIHLGVMVAGTFELPEFLLDVGYRLIAITDRRHILEAETEAESLRIHGAGFDIDRHLVGEGEALDQGVILRAEGVEVGTLEMLVGVGGGDGESVDADILVATQGGVDDETRHRIGGGVRDHILHAAAVSDGAKILRQG